MKFIFLLGGFAGFVLTAAASYFAGHSADRVLLDAAVGCLGSALLFRWFWTIVLAGLRDTVIARYRASLATPPAAALPAKTK